MRRTQIAGLIIILCLLFYIFLYVWPFAAPIIAQHPPHLLSAILDEMLKPHADQGVGVYYPYVLLALAGSLYFVVDFDLKHRRRSTHGTAHHARGKETSRYRVPLRMPVLQWPGQAVQFFIRSNQEFRLLLGKYQMRTISLTEQQQYQHVLLTAPTGAGKSTRFFIPNLLREQGTRSLFIADLKSELYRTTAGWLSQYMQIWLFAPTRPEISAGYNPLAHIKSVEDAQDFAETWVMNTGSSKGDTYWENNARLLISATALHLLATEKAPPFSRLADLITNQSFDEISKMFTGTPSREARYLARQFIENMRKNERLIGSIMTEIGNRFQLLASPKARAVTAVNGIDFREMIETPTAFFLSIPPSATRRYRPLMACLTQQMFAAWEKRGTNGVRCYLDEFANLGYIPGYAEFISTARALKVGLFMAIQNFSQLAERYNKNDADTIKANAVTHLLLPGAGLEETRYYSERMGDTTVATTTINRSGSGGFFAVGETTYSEGETRRRLMTPDELRTMPEDQMLMIEARSAPILLKTTPYFDDRQLAGRANIPYNVTRVREEPTIPQTPTGIPVSSQTGNKRQTTTPVTVEADREDEVYFSPDE